VVSRSPAFEPHVLRGAVQGFTGRTPYALWGDWLAVIGAALVLAGCLCGRMRVRPRS
jgi:apolipoprotein N-acyltransferase